MNNPFDYVPDSECDEAFRQLKDRIEDLRKSLNEEDLNFCSELDEGKMLGVLIASDKHGARHTLYAFSGQLGNGGFHFPGFVPPVFDYLSPDGYFKTHERAITGMNEEIESMERHISVTVQAEYEETVARADAEIAEYKEHCALSKSARAERRKSGLAGPDELASLIRQSQYEKAELHRLKKRLSAEIAPLQDRLNTAMAHLDNMKTKRREASESLQKWLFERMEFLNAKGDTRNAIDIFAGTSLRVPPSGAGECCAPKLLQAAFLLGLHPVSMAEYWYGKPKGGELRIHGMHYPACRGKCLPVLTWMLEGLEIYPPLAHSHTDLNHEKPEILFENRWFCIVNKPSGLLSVPGKSSGNSAQQWLQTMYGEEHFVKAVHRLDRDTSGLLVIALDERIYKLLQSMFACRKVKKTYIAVLEGDYKTLGLAERGRIELPVAPDWLDRPRQRIDYENGKMSVTDYEFVDSSSGRSRIVFYPQTGRTHQLRVHASSQYGLGMPISGDRLYGINNEHAGERLCLHAAKIEFDFPVDGKHYCFEIPSPF